MEIDSFVVVLDIVMLQHTSINQAEIIIILNIPVVVVVKVPAVGIAGITKTKAGIAIINIIIIMEMVAMSIATNTELDQVSITLTANFHIIVNIVATDTSTIKGNLISPTAADTSIIKGNLIILTATEASAIIGNLINLTATDTSIIIIVRKHQATNKGITDWDNTTIIAVFVHTFIITDKVIVLKTANSFPTAKARQVDRVITDHLHFLAMLATDLLAN